MSSVDDIAAFSAEIERIATKKKISIIDAIIWYCETHDYEVESAASLVSTVLKSKIRIEAEELHFLKPSKTTQLPL